MPDDSFRTYMEDAAQSDVDVEADESAEQPADGGERTDLVERVAEFDESLAEAVYDLESAVAERDARIEDLEGRLKRKQADFENYKKRAKKRQRSVEDRATERLVTRLLTVRDNLVRALDQDEGTNIREGVQSTLDEFDTVLADENVTTIEPEPGNGVDPQRHEVLMRVESEQPEGTIVDVYRPGYEMAEKVIQTAQVTVSDGE